MRLWGFAIQKWAPMIRCSVACGAILAALYLLMLNMVSNQSGGLLVSGMPVALLFLVLLLAIGHIRVYLFKTLSTFFIILASLTIFFKWRYEVIITEDIVLSGLINDTALTFELLSWPLFAWFCVTAVVPVTLIWYAHIEKSKSIVFVRIVIIAILLFSGLLLVGHYKYRTKGQIRDYKSIEAINSFSPADLLYTFKKALKAKKELERTYLSSKKTMKPYMTEKINNDRLILMIVGESTRGDYFSLNGYEKETSPELSKISNLYSFRQAKSCETFTIGSLQYMFSPMKCASQNTKVSSASFVTIMKSLGYEVEIYSLQTLSAFYQYLGYDRLVSKHTVVSEQKIGTKDMALIPYVKKSIKQYKKGKKLIIVHTLGSHQTYFDRYTDANKQFTPTCHSSDISSCAKGEIVNTYSNTIVAIDQFISTVIKDLETKKSMLVYTSDHGESLGEQGVYFHGTPRKKAPKEQFRVPFLFWFSDRYMETPEAQLFVKRFNSDMSITHDYLFHSVLGCSGIKSKDNGIEKKLNLCSEE